MNICSNIFNCSFFFTVNHRISDQRGCVEPTSTSEQSKSLSYITREALKYQASELKRKIKKMNHKLQKYAAMCMELNDDNKLIMVRLLCYAFFSVPTYLLLDLSLNCDWNFL